MAVRCGLMKSNVQKIGKGSKDWELSSKSPIYHTFLSYREAIISNPYVKIWKKSAFLDSPREALSIDKTFTKVEHGSLRYWLYSVDFAVIYNTVSA